MCSMTSKHLTRAPLPCTSPVPLFHAPLPCPSSMHLTRAPLSCTLCSMTFLNINIHGIPLIAGGRSVWGICEGGRVLPRHATHPPQQPPVADHRRNPGCPDHLCGDGDVERVRGQAGNPRRETVKMRVKKRERGKGKLELGVPSSYHR